MQNRKSALKCRLKKKAHYDGLTYALDNAETENARLKEEVSPFNIITILIVSATPKRPRPKDEGKLRS